MKREEYGTDGNVYQMSMSNGKEFDISEDAVSREAVINTLPTFGRPTKKFDYILSVLHDIRELPSVTPKSRWIPVSERLPESSGVYIVSSWVSDGEESAILTDANYYDGNGTWYNDNRINWGRDLVTDKIVAWMPLPEPYKEGTGNEHD